MNVLWAMGLLLVGAMMNGTTAKPASKGIVIRDIAYGDHPRQRLDVYPPADRGGKRAVFLWIHGGGWTDGDKGVYDGAGRAVQAMGYVGVAMNYRLTSEDPARSNPHPAQVEDIAQAMAYVAAHAAEWGADPDRFVLAGHSAGGHLSLLYAYGYDKEDRVKAAVSFVGPTDFTDPKVQESRFVCLLVERFLGRTLEEDPALWREASPIHRLAEHPVPTILLYGGKDPLVHYSQGTAMAEALETAGVPHLLFLDPDGGHGDVKYDEKAFQAFLLPHAPPME